MILAIKEWLHSRGFDIEGHRLIMRKFRSISADDMFVTESVLVTFYDEYLSIRKSLKQIRHYINVPYADPNFFDIIEEHVCDEPV